MSSLAFFAADTLGMTLYQVHGSLQATEFHKLHVGPWRVDVKIEAMTPNMGTSKELTFWLKVNDRLPLYAIIRERECWLIVLNPALLQPLLKKAAEEQTTLKEFIVAIKPAVTRIFRWKGDNWTVVAYDKGLL
jgi:hypothetical protein